ncbi:hypothetical protein GUITHDRAFT_151100 [Guillardia theta CCMP2712]|uniref:Uncharacterized protein n=2 Tax=Guillardia theta TaxID=55529 RepID=L1JR16_GUITC|nr:hypothetical protein GUITHDRAFT_151100 [Guillardia theta CCMP2712]EKX50877.1 hypothetical protein GUITHDRAFT_151100 [Guillardia theta CCMP2712]|eukprot:XP_005837857.1 hypothetical protein GUITHDRAFT_151100 [Guillardia theta CCMP2712]
MAEIKVEMAKIKGMIQKQKEQSRMPCQRCHRPVGAHDGTVTSVSGSTTVETSGRHEDSMGIFHQMFVIVNDKVDTILARSQDIGARRLVNNLNRDEENDVLGSSQGQVVSNSRNATTKPQKGTFPWAQMTTRCAYMVYHFGHADTRKGPFKRLRGIDFPTKYDGKRHSDMKYLFERIKEEAEALGIYKADPNREEAGFIFDQCENYLFEEYEKVTKTETNGDMSRFTQLCWMTVVGVLRGNRKRRRKAVRPET